MGRKTAIQKNNNSLVHEDDINRKNWKSKRCTKHY